MRRATLYCSFCGKSKEEVETLITGPAVFICNECVEISTEIIQSRRLEKEISSARAALAKARGETKGDKP